MRGSAGRLPWAASARSKSASLTEGSCCQSAAHGLVTGTWANGQPSYVGQEVPWDGTDITSGVGGGARAHLRCWGQEVPEDFLEEVACELYFEEYADSQHAESNVSNTILSTLCES